MTQFEIIQFYLDLVRRAQERGIVCAITSGMACVAYEVADATKDCDLLCEPAMAERFLALLAESPLADSPCQYRGFISPPLDARWHVGGWTSHFEWPGTEAYLDVFGIAPRARSPWQEEMIPPYANPHVVADMKRTARDKDWPFITGLGVRMVESGDPRGWLHVYDEDRLRGLLHDHPEIPEKIVAARPVLHLLLTGGESLGAAARFERVFWEQLSKRRVSTYEHLLRPYIVAVRKASAGKTLSLLESHAIRCACAEEHLPCRPLTPEILVRMIDEAREATLRFARPELAAWLPDVIPNFQLLIPGIQFHP